MKNLKLFLSIALASLLLISCSNSSSTPLSRLCDTYAEISKNEMEITDAFQAVYKADRGEQEALQEKAVALSNELKTKNEELAKVAATQGDQLAGTDIPCEVSTELGFAVEKAVFKNVMAQPKLANIVIEAIVKGNASPDKTQYVLMLDSKGETVAHTMGTYANGSISINFRITTNKGPETALAYGAVHSLKIVSKDEYTGLQTTPGTEETGQAVNEAVNEEVGEPAFTGEEKTTESENSVTVNGVTISAGANLVETLRKFNNITWDYNADYGVTATVGNVWLVIDDSDLTQKGQDIINSIPGDMENNIQFSVEYIKPTAKITQFEVQ